MDDCHLQKLAIQPGKLSPDFHKSTTQYQAVVSSSVESVLFECVTSDSGASYSISTSGGTKTVSLEEGKVNKIKIEVSAEDGTVKQYFVDIKRLSAKDASLSGLTLSIGELTPAFRSEVEAYSAVIPCHVTSVQVKPDVADVRCEVLIHGMSPGEELRLNVGETKANIEVTSVDKSATKMYTIGITRQQIPRYYKLVDKTSAMEFEDPVSLSPFYRPIFVRDSDPRHVFSLPIITEITKITKLDPISKTPLQGDWACTDYETDHRLSQCLATIPLTYGGHLEPVAASEIGIKVMQASQPAPAADANFSAAKYSTVSLSHKAEVRNWEKKLHRIFDETNAPKLALMAQVHLQHYSAILHDRGTVSKDTDEEGPLTLLDKAACCFACAIKVKKTDPNLHLQLGMVLEERYYAEDMYGLKVSEESADFSAHNSAAKESSKEEECQAICRIRGVPAGAQLSLQLKAIDEEYHHLIDSRQTAKADYITVLFAWKSKQANQEGAAAQKAIDEMTPLGQAYLKYLDALSLDESKAIYHFHVGRMLVIQGNYDDAVVRLQSALSWNVQHVLARFYLGMALALQKGGLKDREIEAIGFLAEGMELLLLEKANYSPKDADGKSSDELKVQLLAENLLRDNNVHMLRGINELGKLLAHYVPAADKSSLITAEDAFHTAAHLASYALAGGLARGDVYKQLEWVLLDAHSNLLELTLATRQGESAEDTWIARRCEQLSALITSSTIPSNPQLLVLQEQTCQRLARLQPCSSRALYLLGASQLARYDDDPASADAKRLIGEATQSFLASIDQEGKPDRGGDPPASVKGQLWWAELASAAASKAKSKPSAATGAGTKSSGPAMPEKSRATPLTPASKGAASRNAPVIARAAPASRGAPAVAAAPKTTSKAVAAAKTSAGNEAKAKTAGISSVQVPAPKMMHPAATGTAGPLTAAKSPAGKSVAAKPSQDSSTSSTKVPGNAAMPATLPAAVVSNAASAAAFSPTSKVNPGATQGAMSAASHNKKQHHARLGLARALSRNPDTLNECYKYYNEAIAMAPEIHDAYIELAELLTNSDPLGAVDVYSMFPAPENPGFDDAYIFGEIVRLLFKAEKYDDPRLATNMIILGKVMGLGYLEKNVKILEEKFKNNLLKQVYAGVNGKKIDDPAMVQFFKFKCWI